MRGVTNPARDEKHHKLGTGDDWPSQPATCSHLPTTHQMRSATGPEPAYETYAATHLGRESAGLRRLEMPRFRFHIIGAQASPVVEVDAANLQDLDQRMHRVRSLRGRVIEEHEAYDVMIAVNRIQFVVAIPD